MFAKKISYLTLVLALVVGLFAVAMPTGVVSAAPIVVYDAVSATLPPNIPSLGFQATQTAEFGDFVHLAGTNRELRTVTVTMSTWALQSTYPAMTDPTGWTHQITLNIYNAIPGTPNTLGSLLATKTQSFLIPWRPEADPTCATPTAWRASDSNCYNGYAFNITFDMASLNQTLPTNIIVGIAYNTNTWGYNPIGLPGPYESLNVGALGTTTFGSDDNTDKVFWNTMTPANYTDGGAAGVGIFREDTNWTPNGTVPIQITADALPTTLYVNQAWSGISEGIDPDGAGPATMMGYDAFATIQAAVDAAAPGVTIHVAAGTYVENVVIDKSLDLLGPNATINPNTGVRVAEAVVYPPTHDPDPSSSTSASIIYIEVDDVTVKGLTVDGDNPALAGGVDAIEGIASYEGVGQIVIENNILQNFTYTGLEFYNYTDTSATTDNYLRFNLIQYVGDTTYNWGIGVLVYNNFYADVTDNVFNVVRTGIQTGNFEKVNPGTTGRISNNILNVWRLGIFHNLWYSNASSISVDHNTINAITYPGAMKWNGILVSSFDLAANTTIVDNIINIPDTVTFPAPGYTVGYNFWNDHTTSPLVVQGGTVTGGDYGIWVNNFEGYNSNANNTSVTVDGVTIDGAAIGVNVWDSSSNTNAATVTATFMNNTITNAAIGLQVSGPQASAQATGNFIDDNLDGVVVSGDAALVLHNNSLDNNKTSITNTGATLVDASSNWQGNFDATIVAGLISGSVDYTPWLNSNTDTDLVTPGFQGDFSYLNVDDDSLQNGIQTIIGEGIALTTPDGTVNVWDGTYYGAVMIDKPLTFQSEHGPAVTTLHGGLTTPAIYVVSIRTSDVTVDGFTVTNPLYNDPMADISGIVAAYYGDPVISNITIINNIVTEIGAETRLLTNPNIHWVATGIVSAGVVDDMEIANNVVFDIHHTNAGGTSNYLSPVGIGVYGEDDVNFTTNVNVHDNLVYDISAINTEGAIGTGYGIAVGWASGDTVVENNIIHDVTGRGISTSLYTFGEVDILSNTLYNIGETAVLFRSEFGGSMIANNIYGNGTGITLGTTIVTPPTVQFNRIFNNLVGVNNLSTIELVVGNNWWGCNEGPNDVAGDCDGTEGLVTVDKWLVLTVAADPASILPGSTSAVEANLMMNSESVDTSADGTVPDGILAVFSAPDGGSVLPVNNTTLAGVASTVFTAPVADQVYQVCAEVDNELICIDLTVENIAPLAEDDAYTVIEDNSLTVAAPGLLTNDTDDNGDALTAIVVAQPANGTLTLNADGSFTYTPDLNFTGEDTFTYKANDGVLDSNNATVTLTVTPVNDDPHAVDDFYTVMEADTLEVAAPGVLTNDVEVDGDGVVVSIVTSTAHGMLSLTADGSFVYIPAAGFYGEDTFEYQLTTYPVGSLASWTDTAVVTITVTPLYRMWMPIISR